MKTNATLESVTIKGGEKPKTTLTFVTTQPADEYNLGKTVSEKMGAGKLAVVNRGLLGELTRKVVNPDTVQRSADVVLKFTQKEVDPTFAELVDDSFDISWETK